MRKVNTNELPEETWSSPKGKFGGAGKEVSEALGRKPLSTDPYPYHSHSTQWEFYHVISGKGVVRHRSGTTEIVPGDAFLFEPGQPHQLAAHADEDLVVYVVADNPMGESTHYPDSDKWIVRSPERRIVRGGDQNYYAGEE